LSQFALNPAGLRGRRWFAGRCVARAMDNKNMTIVLQAARITCGDRTAPLPRIGPGFE
jgi:hypothetical protein